MKNYQEVLKQVNYPTDCMVLDFESYFDQDYSFKNLSTVEYVCNKRFELTGLGYQFLNNGQSHFLPPQPISSFLQSVIKGHQNDITFIIQNAKYDALVLREKFGINPPYIIDILDLARHYDSRMKHDLGSLAKMFNLPDKGDTQQFKGLHYEDMDEIQRFNLAEYCKRDIEIEAGLYKLLLPQLSNPEIEIPLARHTLQIYLDPKVRVDFTKAKELIKKMQKEKTTVIEKTGYTEKEISGNISFATILKTALPDKEEIPMKPGKNKMIPAFAKEDEGMKYLLVHPKEKVRELCQARLAIRSWPLHIKRVQNLINQAKCRNGYLGIPLHYYSGHTGRWGGAEKLNVQNFGGRGRKGSGIHPLIGEIKGLIYA